jgi:hypothetical protein
MRETRTLESVLTAALLAAGLSASACRGNDQQAPPAETQSQAPAQATNQPMTVTGCLKAGESEGTFVLTVARRSPAEQTATYHLIGAEGVNFTDHVGRQVEVSGVVKGQQEVATRSPAKPAENPTGTTGTPTVSTATELDIKRIDVRQIRKVADRCET